MIYDIDLAKHLTQNSAYVKYIEQPTSGRFISNSVSSYSLGNSLSLPESAVVANIQGMLSKSLNELISYERFPIGWDMYMGKEIDIKNINLAKSYLDVIGSSLKDKLLVPTKLSVAPASDGTVGIEFQINERIILFNVDVDQDEIAVSKISPEMESEFTTSINQLDLEEIMGWIAA